MNDLASIQRRVKALQLVQQMGFDYDAIPVARYRRCSNIVDFPENQQYAATPYHFITSDQPGDTACILTIGTGPTHFRSERAAINHAKANGYVQIQPGWVATPAEAINHKIFNKQVKAVLKTLPMA